MELNEAIEAIKDASSGEYLRRIDAAENTDWLDVSFALYAANADLLEAICGGKDNRYPYSSIHLFSWADQIDQMFGYRESALTTYLRQLAEAIRKHKGE